MGGVLLVIGFIVNAIAGLIILVRAFKVSVGWGLGVMFVPFVSLLFVIKHWEDTKGPFLAGLAGGAVMFMGAMFGAMTATPEAPATAAETRSAPRSSDDDDDEDATSYASAAPTPASYQPPPSAYTPSSTPAYNPPPTPATGGTAPATTETQAEDDLWTRRPKYEQVYVDRDTNMYYADKCKKLPENIYRIPKTMAISQGFTEAKCR